MSSGERLECTIRVLTPEDFDIYWPVRLAALRNNPQSFGASFEESSAMTKEEAIGRLSPPDGGFVLGAFVDNVLLGTVGFFRNGGIKNRHRGLIWGVYVEPGGRGRGLGRAMMVKALERCCALPDLEDVILTVYVHNTEARRLYLSLGFATYGLDKRALKVGDEYLDEELMTLKLSEWGG